MEAPNANPVLKSFETNDMTYEFTRTTFTKTSRLPFHDKRLDGTDFVWFRSWNHERITNEARALELVSQNTTIPVPRLLGHGIHSDGRRYLVTEFIEGVPLDDFLGRDCSRPEGQKHLEGTPCKTCSDQAYSNALQFIHDSVLPQLEKLKSKQRGILGFVMPPSWLSPDVQLPWINKDCWETLPLEMPEYVFQHGDLAAHNILMDLQTLQVKALIDWEYAGFFPPGMERWPRTLDSDVYSKRGDHLAHAIAEFLPVEYLECYEKCGNKAELHTLIEAGELPHPERLKQALGE
ncbi:kinase-like domain-containing protein [Hypoxylon argillaceum]|nr:kinase-like domain-containing protein [Hypoxylon argillaceum]